MKIAIYFNEKLIPFLFCICNYAKFPAVKNFGLLTLTTGTSVFAICTIVVVLIWYQSRNLIEQTKINLGDKGFGRKITSSEVGHEPKETQASYRDHFGCEKALLSY